ncbi:helix-turn-helix domain-containing protein [Nonomuraea sp. LPB2021202275-12-8]|uniref:helix-turn-helix domain-containing protein n=1 Tax=Nonomuraea sp. LPB2021202275-12-8 TaxID=3120159 RepID=UPI00300D1112
MIFPVNDHDLAKLDHQALANLAQRVNTHLAARIDAAEAELDMLDVVGVDDAADIMHITAQAVRKMCRDRRIPHYRHPERGGYFIPRSAALAYRAARLPEYIEAAAPTHTAA